MSEAIGRNAEFIADMYDKREPVATQRDRCVAFIVDLILSGLAPMP